MTTRPFRFLYLFLALVMGFTPAAPAAVPLNDPKVHGTLTIPNGATLSLFGSSITDIASARDKLGLQYTIVAVGNSISVESPGLTYLQVMGLEEQWRTSTLVNKAVVGESLATTITKFSTDITPYAPVTTGRPLIVILPSAAGIDCIGGGKTAAQCLTEIQTYAALVQGIGGRIIVGGIPAGNAFLTTDETRRLALNVLIASNKASWDHYLPIGETFGDYAGSAMYSDGQHWSVWGHQVTANLVDGAMRDLYAPTQSVATMPASVALTNGLTIKKDDGSTSLMTLDNSGDIAVVGYVMAADIGGGFTGGGFRFTGTNGLIGTSTGAAFWQMPSGGNIQFWDFSGTSSRFTFGNSGVLDMLSAGAINFNSDTGLARASAGVVKFTNGSTGITGFAGGGGALASATALPVPGGNVCHVTGTTSFTSITTTNLQAGVHVTLIFDGTCTATDGSNLSLAGNFAAQASDTLTLVYDGTNFYEVSRSVNH